MRATWWNFHDLIFCSSSFAIEKLGQISYEIQILEPMTTMFQWVFDKYWKLFNTSKNAIIMYWDIKYGQKQWPSKCVKPKRPHASDYQTASTVLGRRRAGPPIHTPVIRSMFGSEEVQTLMYYSRALHDPVPVPNTEIPNPIYDLM